VKNGYDRLDARLRCRRENGSFSAAAQKLDLVPSVITKRVTQLERMVGTTLFHRSTRKVVLSADGEHHLERIIAAIAAHDQP